MQLAEHYGVGRRQVEVQLLQTRVRKTVCEEWRAAINLRVLLRKVRWPLEQRLLVAHLPVDKIREQASNIWAAQRTRKPSVGIVFVPAKKGLQAKELFTDGSLAHERVLWGMLSRGETQRVIDPKLLGRGNVFKVLDQDPRYGVVSMHKLGDGKIVLELPPASGEPRSLRAKLKRLLEKSPNYAIITGKAKQKRAPPRQKGVKPVRGTFQNNFKKRFELSREPPTST